MDRIANSRKQRYWAGKASPEDLLKSAAAIRKANWQIRADAGIEHIPSADFSLYDHQLDAAFAFDLIPQRFRNEAPENDLDLYFLMVCGLAVGRQTQALEMTKWFDTNYTKCWMSNALVVNHPDR